MNFRTSIFILFFFLSLAAIGQTKIIWHKSHSGNMETFKLALKSESFGLKYSNFGIATKPMDTVIFIADTVIIAVSYNYKDTLYRTKENENIFSEKSKIKENLINYYGDFWSFSDTKFIDYEDIVVEKVPKRKIKNKSKIKQKGEEEKDKKQIKRPKRKKEEEKGSFVLTNINKQKPNHHLPLIYSLLGLISVFSLTLAWLTKIFSKTMITK